MCRKKNLALIAKTWDGRRIYLPYFVGMGAFEHQWKDTQGHRIPRATLIQGPIKKVDLTRRFF